MSLGDIISDSVTYPFSDITKFLIVGVFVFLMTLGNVLSTAFQMDNVAVVGIASIVGLIFSLIVSGYVVKVIKGGISHSAALPDFEFADDLINGIKVLIINIIYFIIPLILAFLLVGAGSLVGAATNMTASLSVSMIIVIIVAIIFAIFQVVAMARFANTGEIGAALSFGEVFADVQAIGIGSIIGFLIVSVIIVLLAVLISSFVAIIPIIGAIIAPIVLGGFVILFYNRGIGLLYSKV